MLPHISTIWGQPTVHGIILIKTVLNTFKEENALKEVTIKGADKYVDIGKTETKDVEEEPAATIFIRNSIKTSATTALLHSGCTPPRTCSSLKNHFSAPIIVQT